MTIVTGSRAQPRGGTRFEESDRVVALQALLDPLGIELVAGTGGAGRRVRWAHISELEDPGPWLRGGELLLTTGLGIPEETFDRRQYFTRLVDSGAAALGLGLGVRFERMPEEFVAMADELDFPIFEVPYGQPLMTLTEMLAAELARFESANLERVVQAQQRMTQVVLGNGSMRELTAAFAEAICGWAVLLDRGGTLITAWPEAARAHVDDVVAEARDLRGQPSPNQILRTTDNEQSFSVLCVGRRQDEIRAFLGFGKRGTLDRFDQLIETHALALLTAEIGKLRAVEDTERRLQGNLIDAILGGSVSPNEVVLRMQRHGFNAAENVIAFAISAASGVDGLGRPDDVLVSLEGPSLVGEVSGKWILIMQERFAPSAEDLRSSLTPVASTQVGRGLPTAPESVASTVRDSILALRVCHIDRLPAADFSRLGWARFLLEFQDRGVLSSFVTTALAPIDEHESQHGGDLLASLEVFLRNNGRWDTAARMLRVHRHTLHNRMQRVEQLTGRDLCSDIDRIELWLAIRARRLVEQ